ncbi:MAG: helix-turn-helix domain-containing protein [Deltaproteobacteria bacterium]|nr:helix-turn-helix domain-containing protein [Deltaproteobacteria bacterium]
MHYSAFVESVESSVVLRRVGARVRAIREARGWTQAELSRRAGLSLRFLADVERGEGNASLLRLWELCAALEVSLASVVAEVGPVVDAVTRFAALDGPARERAMASTGRPTIALVGLRGAGKSTVGRILAEQLGVRFVEVDQAVEERAGLRLGEIFEYHGSDRYRALEREVLAGLLGQRAVLATGGSVVTDASTWALLRERARTVWLRASPESHLRRVEDQGDERPMRGRADALAELREILASRAALYAQAELHVDTEADTPAGCARGLEQWLAQTTAINASVDPRRG